MNHGRSQVMFLRAIPGFDPSEEAFAVAAPAFGSLVSAVQRAMAAGVLAEGEPIETAQMI
jgi:hypothetical protein